MITTEQWARRVSAAHIDGAVRYEVADEARLIPEERGWELHVLTDDDELIIVNLHRLTELEPRAIGGQLVEATFGRG